MPKVPGAERHNLTIRTHVRRMTRLTNAFSKKMGKSRGGVSPFFRVLQLLPSPRHPEDYPRRDGRLDCPYLECQGTSRGRGGNTVTGHYPLRVGLPRCGRVSRPAHHPENASAGDGHNNQSRRWGGRETSSPHMACRHQAPGTSTDWFGMTFRALTGGLGQLRVGVQGYSGGFSLGVR